MAGNSLPSSPDTASWEITELWPGTAAEVVLYRLRGLLVSGIGALPIQLQAFWTITFPVAGNLG